MGFAGTMGTFVVVALFAATAWILYLAIVMAWLDRRTLGASYFAMPADERARFRRRVDAHRRLLRPTLSLLGRTSPSTMSGASFRALGICGPRGGCSPESFEAGARYRPDAVDVFVVTQMRSGTTWMQHLIHQILTRGKGDLAGAGRSLAAVSPWLEGLRSVPLERAPLVGTERPSRIVKTHFPAQLCPFVPQARYVYVARHPVSCFGSCVDFVRAQLGPFAPDLESLHDWYCSDRDMWWGSWPRHVDGWWSRAQEHENVLFVHFESMKDDLVDVARRIAGFLEMPTLDDEESAAIVARCSFDYMRTHAEAFEMHPPSLVVAEADFLPSGSTHRYRDVPRETRAAIMDWCSARIEAYPLRTRYASE